MSISERLTDWHIHIGEFNGVMYSYQNVFKALINNQVKECWYAYFTPRYSDVHDSLNFVLYSVGENRKAIEYAAEYGLVANVLCWIDPAVIGKDCYSLDTLFNMLNYKGIAIHPFHRWTEKTLFQVVEFAKTNCLPVFIHTGNSDYDSPLRFESLIKAYPDVSFHLAHCKEPCQIIHLFREYKNLVGDVAFCPLFSYTAICDAGFKSRMLFGSDFPVTCFYKNKQRSNVSVDILTHEYKTILCEMKRFEMIVSAN